MASIFATGMLWLEKYLKVTGRISASLTVASCIGAAIVPPVVGQLIADVPMVLMYLTLGTIAVCSLLFIATILVGKRIQKNYSTLEQNIET
jgi:fucose permease